MNALSLEYITAVNELYNWKHRDATNFTANLFHLISKADPQNKAKLTLAFPIEVKVFDDWQQSPNEKDFFDLKT